MNKLLGLLLIGNGLWMIKEEKVGYDYYGIHEVHGINTPYEHRMDGWNNEVGRRFGDEYSSEELGKKLADELKEGGLLATSPNDIRLESLYSNDPKLKDPNLQFVHLCIVYEPQANP